jgi:hypothetical protein
MPFTSQAQRGLMHGIAEGRYHREGLPRATAQKLVDEDKPGKLPHHVKEEKGEKKKDSERREPTHYPPLSMMMHMRK